MPSGSSVHREIKEKIREVERQYRAVTADLTEVDREIQSSLTQREGAYLELATMYLPEMNADTVSEIQGKLPRLREAAARHFEKKQKRSDELDNLLRSLGQSIHADQETLEEVDAELSTAATERDRLIEAVQKDLADNETYTDRRVNARTVSDGIEKYTADLQAATRDRDKKLPAFDHNRLFTYLRDKDSGTDRHNSHSLFGGGDAWVADVVNYRVNKKSYDRLTKLPGLIQGEIERSEERLARLGSEIEGMEREASERIGLNDAIQAGQEIGQRRQGLIDKIEAQTDRYNRNSRERESLEDTQGRYYDEAVEEITGYLKGESIAALRRRAETTPSPEDDRLVGIIVDADGRIGALRERKTDISTESRSVRSKLEDLRGIERQFVRNDYESSRSEFSYGFDVGDLLNGFLQGRHSAREVNRRIDSHQNFERPSYSRRSSYSSFDDDDGGFGGFGGGFSLGGSIGGSNFSTGGGF